MPQWGNEWFRDQFFYPLQKSLVQLFYGPFLPQESRMLWLPHPEPFGVMCSALPAANPSASLCPRAFTAPTHKVRRRQWHPTPVLLPGESQGRGSLVGCRRWGRTELDTTEATEQQQHTQSERVLVSTFAWDQASTNAWVHKYHCSLTPHLSEL